MTLCLRNLQFLELCSRKGMSEITVLIRFETPSGFLRDLDDVTAVRSAQHEVHLVDRQNRFRRRLSVAARRNDQRIGIVSSRAPEHLTRLPVPEMGDCARIDDVNIRRFFERNDLVARLFEKFLYRFRIVSIDLAAKRIERGRRLFE